MSDVKRIVEDSHARESLDKVIEEEIGNWTIISHDSGVYEFMGPKNQVIFLAPNTPETEKRAALKVLPKYVRSWLKEKNQ